MKSSSIGMQRAAPTLAMASLVSLAILAGCERVGIDPQGPNTRMQSTSAANDGCPSLQAIPAGFDYPQSASTLTSWVARRDAAATRAHGWNLWAALNSETGAQPVWRSWCTATQAFAGRAPPATAAKTPSHGERPMRTFKLANGKTTGVEPINFPIHPVYPVPDFILKNPAYRQCIQPPSATSPIATLAEGTHFQNNGDVMVPGVVYSPAAYDWIRAKRLYETKTLAGMVPPAGQTRQMAPMPDGSVVLKPMMWPVRGDGYTALPVWDDPRSDGGKYSGYEVQSQWPRAVAIHAPGGPQPRTVRVGLLHGVFHGDAKGNPTSPLAMNQYVAEPVGIDQFYHYKPDLMTLAACDRAILDASAYYAYGRSFAQGDALALIAMHIMTKEQPAWTFQSIWWSDRPDQGPYAANRPALPAARGPWKHYLMTSTYGWPAIPGGRDWPIAYNPYIELAADHPIATNCMNCHHRAAWPEKSDSYLATGGPSALAMFGQDNLAIFAGKIGVDALWSIADRVPAPPSSAREPVKDPRTKK